MAVFLEKQHDQLHKPIPALRVMPDLRWKLPGLFGAEAPPNSVNESLAVAGIEFFPRQSIYPIDYVGVHAKTRGEMDQIDVSAHTALRDSGWQAEVRASIHDEPGFEAWWEGNAGDPNSHRISLMWADTMPTLSIDTRRKIVLPGHDMHGAPIGMIEFVKRRGKGKHWLRDAYADYPVELKDLNINLQVNMLFASLVPRDTTRRPFRLGLPLVLETNLRSGVPGRLISRRLPLTDSYSSV